MLAKCGKIRNQHIGGFLRMRTNWLLFYRNCFENFGLFANLIMMFHNIQIESNDWIITKIIAQFVNKSFTGTRVFLNNPDIGVPPRKSHFTFVILKHLIFTLNFHCSLLAKSLLLSVFTFTFESNTFRRATLYTCT